MDAAASEQVGAAIFVSERDTFVCVGWVNINQLDNNPADLPDYW